MSVRAWDGTNNNWDSTHWFTWTDGKTEAETIAHAVLAGKPVTGDTVYVSNAAGVSKPATTPAAVTLRAYTCYGLNYDVAANLTVTLALTMGTALGADTPYFGGTAAAGCAVLFQGASRNNGAVGDYATFNDSAENYGTVDDYATFNDSARNGNGAVGDYATFNESADNYGTVGDYATFNEWADNDGTVGDYATFNDCARNLNAATVGDYATFNTVTTQTGTFSGSTYYAESPALFAGSCLFTGVTPIYFYLLTTLASVNGAFTSDGGTTPIQVQVLLDGAAVADLIPANLRSGKTVLGVAGTVVLSGFGPYPVGATAIGPFPIGANSIGPYPVV